MKLIIDVPKSKLLQVLVPDNIQKCEIVNYGYAGTWLMESNSKDLNAWKMKLPNGKYEVIGRVNDVVAGIDLSEIETDKNFIIRCLGAGNNSAISMEEILNEAQRRKAKHSVQYVDYSLDTWTVANDLLEHRKKALLADGSVRKVRIEYEM